MKALTTSDEKRTPEQEIKFNRLFEDAMARVKGLILKKVDPGKGGLQVLLENGDEFFDHIVEAGIEKAREMTTPDQYSDEEVESSYEYPGEYRSPRPIKKQIKKLAEIFGLDPKPALEFADKVLPTLPLPNGAEGQFVIISPSGLEKLVPQAASPEDRYCKGVLLVLEKIASSRRFHNYREGQIDPNHLRQHARTVVALAKIAEVQKGDILIVPAQLGFRHRGRSVRRARICFTNGEFGLRSLDVGAIALTHPERFVRFEELDTDCSGDEFAPAAGRVFSRSPCFFWCGDGLGFDARGVGGAGGDYGSGSAFPTQ